MHRRFLYGSNIHANNIRIHYLRYGGKGTPLVLVPGITSPAITSGFVAERFAEKFDVYVVDVRGRGLSETGPGLDYGVATYATDIAGFIKVLQLEPVILLGHSMGARIAARVAAERRVVISQLVLADPPVTGPGRRPYNIPLDWFLSSIRLAQQGHGMEAFRDQTPHWAEEHIRLRAEWLHTCDLTAVSASYDNMHREDLHADLASISQPTLFLSAEKGAILEDELQEVRKIAPAFTSVRLSGIGHMMPFEDLDLFAGAVLDYLAE